jgi:hypothetical protein
LSEVTAYFHTQQLAQVFEYMQDAMMQLRDDLRVAMNDQVVQLEQKHASQLAAIQDRIMLEGGYSANVAKQQSNMHLTSNKGSRMTGNLGGIGGSNQLQPPPQSFSLPRGDTANSAGDYGGLITQAAIEHACQLTVDRSRHEFLSGLHDQLRRA